MPTKRFSTRSSRPMPLALPSAFSRVSSVAGDRRSPLMATASPRSNSIVISVALSGAASGRDGALTDHLVRLVPGILQRSCPRRRSAAGWRRRENGASPRLSLAIGIWCCFGEVDQRGAAGQVPFAPGRDDLDVRLQRVIGQLEAHLVVALAGGAMGDGVGADLPRRSRSGAWRSAAGRSRCRAGTALRTARWRGTSGRRSRGRIPRAGRR